MNALTGMESKNNLKKAEEKEAKQEQEEATERTNNLAQRGKEITDSLIQENENEGNEENEGG
jgi:HD superfamily phosphodiesterase